MRYPLFVLPLSVALIAIVFIPHHISAEACSNEKGSIVNVKDFGATGDGTSDDTAAIQTAANCVSSFLANGSGISGATLYFPNGTYLISKQITVNSQDNGQVAGGVVLRGEAMAATKVVSNSSAGLFSFVLPNGGRKIDKIGLDVHDISFVANMRGAGDVIDLIGTATSPGSCQYKDGVKGLACPELFLQMENINISGSNNSDYFNYGLHALGLDRPSIDNVTMSGGGGSACFFMDYSYGTKVSNSFCSGVVTGVSVPHAAEADEVLNSQLIKVGIGVDDVVNGAELPGPSGDVAKISGDIIDASTTGVVLTNKAWVFISGTTFETTGGNSYQDVVLTNAKAPSIVNNTFVGSGAGRTGITLLSLGRGNPIVGSIADNNFGSLPIEITIGSGVTKTTIFNNTPISSSANVINKGSDTTIVNSKNN